MTGFLLDSNLLSGFSRSAIPPDTRVLRWVESVHPDIPFTRVLSIGEIRKGIQLLPPSKKRSELEQWLASDLNGWLGDNLLPVTKAISDRWGMLAARSQQQGRPLATSMGFSPRPPWNTTSLLPPTTPGISRTSA